MKLEQSPRPLTEVYELRDVRAIDGDTIEARIILGFMVSIIRRIRLKNFFAPEHGGATPDAAHHAQERLQQALSAGELMLQGRGSKEDRYGRILAHVLRDGVCLNPHEVLGPWQMEEAAHNEDLKTAKRNRTRKRGAL